MRGGSGGVERSTFTLCVHQVSFIPHASQASGGRRVGLETGKDLAGRREIAPASSHLHLRHLARVDELLENTRRPGDMIRAMRGGSEPGCPGEKIRAMDVRVGIPGVLGTGSGQ